MLAAHDLLLEHGYARTSITDIAAAAGVARPTVLSVFGTKAALLHAVIDQAMAGGDEPVPVAEHPWFRPVWSATTPEECLDAYAHVCLLIGRRSAAIIEVVRRAADDGPEIAALFDEHQLNRRTGASTIVARVRTLGPLAPGLTRARAADLLWLFNDSGHYRALVLKSGWSERAYERWLADQLRHALLP